MSLSNLLLLEMTREHVEAAGLPVSDARMYHTAEHGQGVILRVVAPYDANETRSCVVLFPETLAEYRQRLDAVKPEFYVGSGDYMIGTPPAE